MTVIRELQTAIKNRFGKVIRIWIHISLVNRTTPTRNG